MAGIHETSHDDDLESVKHCEAYFHSGGNWKLSDLNYDEEAFGFWGTYQGARVFIPTDAVRAILVTEWRQPEEGLHGDVVELSWLYTTHEPSKPRHA